MLGSVHDTCESKTWMPNVCPKLHPACGSLQNMQASSALGHCASVIPTMPPSPLSTALSCSWTWSWLRAANTFAFLWINMQMDTYYRHLHGVSHMYRGQPTGIILWKWSIAKKPPSFSMHVKVCPPLSRLPTTNDYIFIFASRNEGYLALPIY